MANAAKNDCVSCRATPVTYGATMPAKLPMQFCRLVHFPAALGPERCCVNAQLLEENIANETQARTRKKLDKNPSLTSNAGNGNATAGESSSGERLTNSACFFTSADQRICQASEKDRRNGNRPEWQGSNEGEPVPRVMALILEIVWKPGQKEIPRYSSRQKDPEQCLQKRVL